MENVKMNIMREIVNLRYDMDFYREEQNWYKVAQIRLEIARLEAMLGETY